MQRGKQENKKKKGIIERKEGGREGKKKQGDTDLMVSWKEVGNLFCEPVQ